VAAEPGTVGMPVRPERLLAAAIVGLASSRPGTPTETRRGGTE
jgi:hypothetical protein